MEPGPRTERQAGSIPGAGGPRPEAHRIALRLASGEVASDSDLLVCRAGLALVAFAAGRIRTCLALPPLEPIAGAPSWIAGRVTASGFRFPVLDVARRLSCRRPGEEDAGSVVLVVDGLAGPAGLLVHEARGVCGVAPADLRGLSQPDDADFVLGLVERPEGLLLVLSVPALLLSSGFDEL